MSAGNSEAQQKGGYLTGRQIAAWIYKNFRISGESEAVWDLGEVLKGELKNDNVLAFDTKWDEVISSMHEKPFDTILEHVYRMQLEKSNQLKFVIQV